MKDLTGLLAMLALVASASVASAQTVPPKDDCKEQSATDDDACSPAIVITETTPLGGLGTGAGVAIGISALVFVALAGGSSGSHSGSH